MKIIYSEQLPTIKVITLLLPVILFFNGFAFAQEIQDYSGKYQIGDYKGEANFQYKVVEKDTILHGSFELHQANLNDLIYDADNTYSFTGSFEEDTPNGTWVFLFGEYQTDKKSRVIDNQYRLLLNGKHFSASGGLNKGKASGKWKFIENSIQNSEVIDTLFLSELSFNLGIPNTSFRIEDDHSSLIGRTTKNGFASDTWSLFSDIEGYSENWYFSNGKLQKIERELDGIRTTYPIFDTKHAIYTPIELDKNISVLINMHLPITNRLKALDNDVNALLKKNANSYQKIDGILRHLNSASFSPGIQLNVPVYNKSDEDKVLLDSIVQLATKSKKLATDLLNNKRLNLLVHSDEAASKLYDLTADINQNYVVPLAQLITYKELDLLNYIDEEKLVTNLFTDTKTSYNVLFEQLKNNGLEKSMVTPETAKFTSILGIAKQVTAGLDGISKILFKRIKKEEQQDELVALEAQLIKISDQLVAKDTLPKTAAKNIHAALANINLISENLITEYSKLDANTEKLPEARSLVSCMNQLNQLADEVVLLPSRKQEIEERYVDNVWNPFIAILMKEEVKKRITSAYKTKLIPYLLENTTTPLTCETCSDINALYKKLHERMLQLRDEDTGKLERKLKKVNDPSEILELLDLPTLTPNK